MNLPLLQRSHVRSAMAALRKDLLHDDGPRISTMRNYRFAIVQYKPADEYELRREVAALSTDLETGGWVVFTIDLARLVYERVRAQGPEWTRRVMARERKQFEKYGHEAALIYLNSKITPLIEGPDGIAADCSRILRAKAAEHPDKRDRTVALIGRAGALYPFYRSSALLRHLDGQTDRIPVILLYPGERRGLTGLSFMGMNAADNDYRPRIYP